MKRIPVQLDYNTILPGVIGGLNPEKYYPRHHTSMQGIGMTVAALLAMVLAMSWFTTSRAGEHLSAREDIPEAQMVGEIFARIKAAKNHREKLNLYEELVQSFKDSGDPATSEQVAQAIGEMTTFLARDMNGAVKLDNLITLLKGGAHENQIPRLLIVKASIAKSNAAKQQFFDQILAEYDGSRDPTIQHEVLKALVAKARLPGDSGTRLALLNRVVTVAGTVDLEAFSQPIIDAALARAGLLDDKAEIVRGYDVVLDEGRRRAADFSGNLQHRLVEVLDAKIAFTDDPGLKDRYYDGIIALNPGMLPMASALLAKTHREGLERGEKIEIFDRIIADYAGNPDNRLRKIVNSAYFGKARLATDNAKRVEIFDMLIARSWADSDPELRLDAARALLAKANLANDKAEMLRAYDRIIDCYWITRKDWWHGLREIILHRGRLAGENMTPEHYYDERIAHANDDNEIVAILGEKAYVLPDKDAKRAVYDEIIARFQNSEDLSVRREVVNARKSKLRLGADEGEKLQLYKAIISDGIGEFGDDESEVAEAYEQIISMLGDRAEKVAHPVSSGMGAPERRCIR